MESSHVGGGNVSQFPWRTPSIYIVLASSLIGVMGVSLISPVLPELRPVFNVSDAQIGLIITAYTLPGIFLTPFIGLLADRLGRKPVMVPLLIIFGVAGSSIATTSSFPLVILLRFIQGIGASALITLSITLIGDMYKGDRRDSLIGINGSLISAGAAVYPLLGGILALFHWSSPFLFFGVSIIVGLGGIIFLEEPTHDSGTELSNYLARQWEMLQIVEAQFVLLGIFFTFFIFYGAIITALPLLLSDQFGFSPGRIGTMLAVVSIASATASSQYWRITNHSNPTTLIGWGYFSFGLSLLLLVLSSSVPLIIISLIIFGIGFGITLPAVDTTAMALVSEDLRGGIMGMRTGMLRLGQTLGPIGFTVAAESLFPVTTTGYRILYVIFSVTFLLGALIVWFLIRAGFLGSSA